MKQILFFIAIIFLSSCKKEEQVIPPAKFAQLEVYYIAEGGISGTHYFFNYDNQIVENELINSSGSYQKIIQAQEKKAIRGSISASSGYWKQIKVVFNHDTIFNERSHSNISFDITLPAVN